MPPKPLKAKKQIKTLDEFSRSIHEDYLAISEKMATKDDIQSIRDDMATKDDIRKIREEMATKENFADLGDRIAVAKDDIQEQIAGLKYAKEIDELRERVNVLEAKLGIKRTRQAA
jgi:hypothetical protein